MSDQVPESNEVAGYQYRLAQAARLIRFHEAGGLDIAMICNERGKIVPEAQDYYQP